MSLDVYIRVPGYLNNSDTPKIYIRKDGMIKEISREEWDSKCPGKEPVTFKPDPDDTVFSSNITHNLNKMADAAGIYQYLWRPEELNITHANQLIEPLAIGLERLKSGGLDTFEEYNAANGWGKYENLVSFVEAYLEACKKYPDGEISVSR